MIDLSTGLNLLGITYNLAGFLIMVKEVRYAHLTEYHSLNLDEVMRVAKEFETAPGPFTKKRTIDMFGEKVVHLFGPISDEEWEKLGQENRAKYEAEFRKHVENAEAWKKRVPPMGLNLRMKWLTAGALLTILGTLLQGISMVM